MSHDFQRGLLPVGASVLPPEEYGFSALPFQPTINHTDATVPQSPRRAIEIPGGDDPRKIPPLILAVFFASGWDFDISISGPAGLAYTWTGTIARGRTKNINDGGATETGTALTTIKQAWSAGFFPPSVLALSYPEQKCRWNESLTADTPEESLVFEISPYDVTYYAIPNVWTFSPDFFAGVNDGTSGGDQATVSHSGSGENVSGLTICGVDCDLNGNDVVSFFGTMTPTGFLT